MEAPLAPPKRRKNASKKNKKSWRKNTDIEDVEEFLEDERLEERLGGKFEDRPDDSLFTLDHGQEQETEVKGESAKAKRRRELKEKPLKCFQNLELKTGISDPIKKRNRVKSVSERQNPLVKKMLKSQMEAGILKDKWLRSEADRTLAKVKKASIAPQRNTRRRTEFDFDLWGGGEQAGKSTQVVAVTSNEWLYPETKKHNLKNTRQLQRSLPDKHLEKTTSLPSVELPLAGSSYNPSVEDHREILWKAAIVEIHKEKAHRKIERQTTMMFPDKNDAPTEESILKEMSQGIPELTKEEEEEEENDQEEIEDEDLDQKKNPNKAKSRKDRRKEREEKTLLKRKKYENTFKSKNQDIFRLKSLKREIAAREELTQQRIKKRSIKKELKMAQPSVLSAVKYEEPEIPIKLTEELTGNLRSLKPEGSILQERFKSLQKRNIIETRVGSSGILKRKKRKKYEKRNYKMPYEINDKQKK